LVLHGDDEVKTSPEGNLLLMKLSGAVINIVSADLVAGGMATAEEEFRERGEVPLVVPGGGHTLAGALAYVDAIEEIQTQLNKWIPDLIVLASGTGATQAGIVVGCSAARWPTRVIGISVARPAARGAEVVSETCRQLRVHLDCRGSPAGVDFRDDWICGGYEHADGRVFSAIATAAASDGLILDPTYTGKAFAALLDLVATGEIARGERVLFWHTGGLLNLLSSDSREVISS
jgi:1-aminocyclopropane-1-carboxylate deaminase/D-cysteine desulfhydrase-like pyridoxal-dependent ACC family enzyme